MRTGVEPLTMTLRDVCFLHWPVPKDVVADRVPPWLTPDLADGSAWVSAVTTAIARMDAFGLPVREDIEAVNLRTYVMSPDGDRGVYFLSLDLTDRLAAATARRLFRLPYYAADVERTRDDGRTVVRSRRGDDAGASFAVSYEPSGPTQTASPDTLASFLTERYRYYTEGPLGTHLVGNVGHDPWALQSAAASVADPSLLETVGLGDPDERPLAHYSDGTTMRIGPPKPLAVE